jgi:hypothetical protein
MSINPILFIKQTQIRRFSGGFGLSGHLANSLLTPPTPPKVKSGLADGVQPPKASQKLSDSAHINRVSTSHKQALSTYYNYLEALA